MRFLPLAVLGLILAIAPIVAAQAADRPAGGQGRTQTEVTAKAPGKAAATRRPAAGSAAQRRAPQQLRQATQRRAAQRAPQDAVQRSARVRSQLGATRDSRAATSATGCRSGARGAACRSQGRHWTRGLAPAAGVQASECPHGTMATLARGHDDIVRCIPI
jgi:hypothetical protein